MAAKAFILVSCEPARTQAVGDRLRGIQGALVYEVMGPFDFILDIETDTPENLNNVLRSKVRAIAGVTDTLTCIVMASPGPEATPPSG
jgi:DNA-binding Lrp family transcriptional regulator